MNILKFDTAQMAAECLANELYKQVKQKPDSTLGVATGRTMDAVYHALLQLHKKDKLDCSRLKAFALDEYIGLDRFDKSSFEYYLDFHLFGPLGFDQANTFVPDVLSNDYELASSEYEEKIVKAGGIDLLIMGIGVNGHIALNEPGSAIDSKTRVVALSSKTINSNKSLFKDQKNIPNTAISMGIGTIMKAKKCFLIATGTTKADIIAEVIHGDISSHLPASFLKDHKDFTLILDNEAAKQIK